ncbi:MAG: ATP-binding protein [Candidatus Accumulibacter sp.]|jgi:hypothetical protein|nr:ATP-binding protein [Accumulibacter sp.]
MLRAFSLQNFHSFRDQQRISLELSPRRRADDDCLSCASPQGKRLSKALCLIGPNASGKTNLINALVFVTWFVKYSFAELPPDGLIPLMPHFSAQDEPSEFELEFEMDEREWFYRLRASEERVFYEALFTRDTRESKKRSIVFERTWDPAKRAYSVKQQKFGMLPGEAAKVRQNASLISTGAQYGVDLALRLASIETPSNVDNFGHCNMSVEQILRASEFYMRNTEMRDKMVHYLNRWDLGLHDVVFEEIPLLEKGETVKKYIPHGVHRGGDEAQHRLMFMYESNGTQALFFLLSKILRVLRYGGLALIDELELSLHPHMLEPILDLFFLPEENPKNAQIIFTCHSVDVLSFLHKPQIVLVEKDDRGESEAWRLDSVTGVRSDDNLAAKYLAGAYGAVPRL